MKNTARLLTCLLFAVGINANATFLPPDLEINLSELPSIQSDITEAEFNELLIKIENIHKPIISKHGGKLSIQRQWSNDKLNARATQMFGQWRVEMSGGLARYHTLTRDGFALIACHELGHHLGGFPYASSLPIPIPVPGVKAWAATEGQSDYYATHVCARNIWKDEMEKNASFRNIVPENQKAYCDEVWEHMEDQNLCYRNLMASESVGLTLGTLMKKEKMPSFETPDESVVDKTNSKHPDAQCRMDTSFQGALCTQSFSNDLIPGKNVSGGAGSTEAEREALMTSCSVLNNYDVGLRPRCWFKNRL